METASVPYLEVVVTMVVGVVGVVVVAVVVVVVVEVEVVEESVSVTTATTSNAVLPLSQTAPFAHPPATQAVKGARWLHIRRHSTHLQRFSIQRKLLPAAACARTNKSLIDQESHTNHGWQE
jgi:hypothetical protein